MFLFAAEFIFLHCHKAAGKFCREKVTAAAVVIAIWRCRSCLVWTPKDEVGHHPELAANQWFTGNKPVGYYVAGEEWKMVMQLVKEEGAYQGKRKGIDREV